MYNETKIENQITKRRKTHTNSSLANNTLVMVNGERMVKRTTESVVVIAILIE